MSFLKVNGVPLSVAYKSFRKDLMSTVTDPAKSSPKGLNQLWNPERDRVCTKPYVKQEESPKEEMKEEEEKVVEKKHHHQKYSKTQIVLVWATIIALLLMVEYFILKPK